MKKLDQLIAEAKELWGIKEKSRWVQYDEFSKKMPQPTPRSERLVQDEVLPDISDLNQKILSLIEDEKKNGKKKANYACSICGEQGHNCRTCPAAEEE